MADILLFWRDYKQNWTKQVSGENAYYWHTNAKIMLELHAGDKLWLVSSGKNVGHKSTQAGFIVGVWQVRYVVHNPGNDPLYPKTEYKYRIIADPTSSIMFEEPIEADGLLRPEGRDKKIPIGRYLQGPRKLKEDKVRKLREVAGPKMALSYLKGR